MLAPWVVQRVKQLLAEGRHSQRQIAQITGVSRGTVHALATGKRRDPPEAKPGGSHADEPPPGAVQRCNGCGALVQTPCLLCRVRRLVAEGRLPRPKNASEGVLGLGLREEHRRRYEQVRKRREAAAPAEAGDARW